MSAVGQSAAPEGAEPQSWSKQAAGAALTLILAERDDLLLLLVAQEAVEFLQRRPHGRDRRDHRLEAHLRGGEPARGGQRRLGRAGGLDVLGGLEGGLGEIVERGALGVVGLDGPLKLIDRQAGDLVAALVAHLRQTSAAAFTTGALGRETTNRHQQGSGDRRDTDEVTHRFLPSGLRSS